MSLQVVKRDFKPVDDGFTEIIPIPCGRCIGCRMDYSRRWADRLMLELDHHHSKAFFLTLTYEDFFLPLSDKTSIPSLRKKDWQDFFKRFREAFRDQTTLRFYAAGEYGEHTLRPHYHAIVFGLCLDDFKDLVYWSKDHDGHFLWESKTVEDIWKKGRCILGEVSWQTCAYVARYVTKKLKGDEAVYYEIADIEPEFALMSRRPGIAGFYLEDHPDALEYAKIPISDPNGSTVHSEVYRPDYLVNKIELTKPDLYDRIKFSRTDHVQDAMTFEMSGTSIEDYSKYLKIKEYNMEQRLKTLRRGDDL